MILSEPYNLPQVGQLVRSKAGRDHGQYYLVYRVEPTRVSLVDGRKRLPANPKIKNNCHLQKTKLISAEFVEKATGGKLTAEDIRACLAGLMKNNPDEEALDNV